MAVIKTIEKGESLTFGFVFPETYNLANLEDVKIYIGSTAYAHTMVSRTARVELTSNATALLTGRNIIHFVIDDAVFGIKKVNCGMLEVLPTQATHKDESVNTGYDVEIVLSINVETITVESILYNTLKGDKGDAGTIEVGTVETGDAGTDVIVENVGTDSEAILNFTIPRGDAGYTPYIGVNGNWFINGVDTGVQAEGDATESWVTDNFVAKETGKSLIADTEITRLAGVTNQTLSGLGGEATSNKQNSLANDGAGVKFPTVDAVNLGLATKPAKTIQVVAGAGMTGGGTLESDRTLNVVSANDGITVNADNIQLNAYDGLDSTSATQPLFANQGRVLNAAKVDKVTGKSLILDTEISRLASVTNQTLSGLGGEATANKQNSLAVDGTGSKYPTVDAVSEGLALKADTVDVMQNKQSIATLESILSDVNVNQEAQVTTLGVDTVSLPKTAANTGMQVQMFGQSAQNLVVNGDFRNGLTGWKAYFTELVETDNNILVFIANAKARVQREPPIVYTASDVIYMSAKVKATSNSVGIGIASTISTRHSGSGNWETLSRRGLLFNGYLSVIDDRASGWDSVFMKDYLGINLTATFGVGNEPTKEQCDLLFANYFEGTDNVLGTGRVRSVDADGENASILQLTTPPLRSNGLIKDEIRKGTNGYELVKRISDLGAVLATPVITTIPHAGLLNSNSNGTVYFEPAVADAGVYGANIAIQLTDFPISTIESISKYSIWLFTPLNPATAVIAADGLTFTHPDLVSGDLVAFTYLYDLESTGRSMTLTHYDSRYVVKDTANTNVYKITPKITSGTLTWTLTLV